MSTILKVMLENKKREVEDYKVKEPLAELKKKILGLPPTRDFKIVFSKENIGIIAEIKSRSPSAGPITNEDPLKIAEQYEKSRAVAISVLTDEQYFGGKLPLMETVKGLTSKPILRKDFVIDEYQIYQSRAYGADAVLLISYILTKEALTKFIKIAKELGMECLVELHSKDDLSKIPEEAEIYGINNRDIQNLQNEFKTDLNVTFNLLKLKYIPEGKILISESGINTSDDVKRLKDAGVRGILTGTTILKGLRSPQDVIGVIDSLLSRTNNNNSKIQKSASENNSSYIAPSV